MKSFALKLSQTIAVALLLLLSAGDRTSQATITADAANTASTTGDRTLVASIDRLSYAATPLALALAVQTLQPPQNIGPTSGSQLHRQRQIALILRIPYTQLTASSLQNRWINATEHPSYEQWKVLLEREAAAVANHQSSNRLNIIVGDSLSQWLPPDLLPSEHSWLNQGISGDTTQGVLGRLSNFASTEPETIYVMAGINDLKNGASSDQILTNLEAIMEQLRTQHPNTRIVVQSILPTRVETLPSEKIRELNRRIAVIAQQKEIVYLDLHPSFVDESGDLRAELTTDGIHLNRLGYQVWQIAISAM